MTPEEIVMALKGGAPRPNPAVSQGLDAAFAVPPQQLQRMVGEVVPLPITPGPNAGPPASGSTVLDTYKAGMPPNVKMLPVSAYEKYLNRLWDNMSRK